MGARSCVIGAELRMRSLTVDFNTFSGIEKFAVVVPVTSVEVEVIGFKAVFTLSFSICY